MDVSFTKMEGCGNDFVVLDRLRHPQMPLPAPAVVARLAHRRTGIGFDQLLVVESATTRDASAAFRIFNADGSSAMQCGNGARCVAAHLRREHDFPNDFVLMSPAGAMPAQIRGERVRIGMGEPGLSPGDVPFAGATRAGPLQAIELAHETVTLGVVSMGNPHAVLVVDDVDGAPVATLGPAVQRHAAFPQGVNVGFLHIDSRQHGRLRVFERGVGETAACGSGACAAMVVGRRLGRFDEHVTLALAGGELVVSWRGAGHQAWLEGPAHRVYEGRITL
jgi:diaminopimelate epimerase